jgi:putative phosphoribosyl transferase
VLNEEALEDLAVPEEYIERIAKKEIEEIGRRLALLRGERRPESQVGGQIVILVDDGLVTGVTALAAARPSSAYASPRLVLAVPVGTAQTAKTLRSEVDELVCLEAPSDLTAIGLWYGDFYQVPDEEVVELLERATHERDERAASGPERRT